MNNFLARFRLVLVAQVQVVQNECFQLLAPSDLGPPTAALRSQEILS